MSETFFKGRKYLLRAGVLYTIRDRESDDDYDPDEDWTFDAWCGPAASTAIQTDYKAFQQSSNTPIILSIPSSDVYEICGDKMFSFYMRDEQQYIHRMSGNYVNIAKNGRPTLACLAKKMCIPGVNKMKKAELIACVTEYIRFE